MIVRVYLVFSLIFLSVSGFDQFSYEPDFSLEEFVAANGYPFEIHHVVTQDGYILTLHRIPVKSENLNDELNHSPVLIMHGLLGCSADWILPGRNKSIAFLLADNGYDVWLGNSRGTTDSKNHTKFPTWKSEFWDFSWHEMGVYDAPAMIDYILELTKHEKLFYIGFSQGTTQFWVLMSLKPEYNEKVKLMTALAPVAYTGHIQGLLRPLSFYANLLKSLYKLTGFFEMLPNNPFMKYFTSYFCRRHTISQPVCEMFIFMIAGFSRGEMDHEHLTRYLKFSPAGCSYKQLVHYAMGIQNPGHFRPYDYGLYKNMKIYGAPVPPEYPLENIITPVILYNGLNDWLSHPKDVELLNKKLPNVVDYHTVRRKRLNHFDFLYGNHIREFVYNRLIQQMNDYL